MTSKLHGCSSHHLPGAGYIVAALLQATRLVECTVLLHPEQVLINPILMHFQLRVLQRFLPLNFTAC